MKTSMYYLKNMLNWSNSRLDIVEENFSIFRYQKKLFTVKTKEEKLWIEEKWTDTVDCEKLQMA